jgi:hypothetical protein
MLLISSRMQLICTCRYKILTDLLTILHCPALWCWDTKMYLVLTTHLDLVPRSRMRGATSPLPQYVFMAWCLVKYRDNFTFTFTLAQPPHKLLVYGC